MLDETEQEHRIAHALLIPTGMYLLWGAEESKLMPQLYRVPVPKRYSIGEEGKKVVTVPSRIAVFKLLQLDQIEPPQWAYAFLGWEKITPPVRGSGSPPDEP